MCDASSFVIAGLDPAIHPRRRAVAMDGRVKPGHDKWAWKWSAAGPLRLPRKNEPNRAQAAATERRFDTKSAKSTKAACGRRGLRAKRAFVPFVSHLAAGVARRSKANFGRRIVEVKKQSQSSLPRAHKKALLSYAERLG